MSGDVVVRAKAALEGVSPGPWQCRGNIWSDPDGAYKLVARINPGGIGPVNAEFIAAARSLVPELVTEVERLRNLVAALEVGQSNARILLEKCAEAYSRAIGEAS